MHTCAHPGSRALAVAGLLVGLSTGCFRYEPGSVTPDPGSHIRLVLVTASTIPVLADTSGHALVVDGVLELKGVLIAAAGDTQVVRLGELRTASGPVGHMKGRLAKVATASIARVTERRFDATRTALGGAGAALLATAALLMAFVIVLVHVAA